MDPGLARTGYGIIEGVKREVNPVRKNNSSRLAIVETNTTVAPNLSNGVKIVNYGCVVTRPTESHARRLQIIYREVGRVINKFKPEVAVLEELFFAKNAKTALKVGEARGVIILAAGSKGLEIKEFTPLEVKLSVVGRGRASKPQVQYMLKHLLAGLKEIPRQDDAADALAVALCYFHSLSRQKIKND